MSWNFVSAAALAGLLTLALLACSGDPGGPEREIRALVDEAEAAVEADRVKPLADMLTENYRDQRHSRRRDAVATLYLLLRRFKDIHLFTLIRDIAISEDGESAELKVLVAKAGVPIEDRQAVLSVEADLLEFDLSLVHNGSQWRVAGARWQRVPASAL